MNKRHLQTLAFMLISLIAFSASAQTKVHNSKVYYAVVDTGSDHLKAILSGATDSTLILESLQNYSTFTLSYKKVEQIKIKARGRIGRGIAIGAGSGLIVGLIIGNAAAPSPNADTTGLFGVFGTIDNSINTGVAVLEGGLLGLIGGGAAGALIGSIPKEKIEVNRDQKQFLAAVPEIKMYCHDQ